MSCGELLLPRGDEPVVEADARAVRPASLEQAPERAQVRAHVLDLDARERGLGIVRRGLEPGEAAELQVLDLLLRVEERPRDDVERLLLASVAVEREELRLEVLAGRSPDVPDLERERDEVVDDRRRVARSSPA